MAVVVPEIKHYGTVVAYKQVNEIAELKYNDFLMMSPAEYATIPLATNRLKYKPINRVFDVQKRPGCMWYSHLSAMIRYIVSRRSFLVLLDTTDYYGT